MTATGLRDQVIDITVAVSCCNEQSLITSTLDNVVGALTEVGCSYEIIIVDDVSRDNSVKRVQDYIKAHPALPTRLKVNETNRGLGNNYVEAAFLGRGKYYRLYCGDDGEPREVLAALFRHMGKTDMIIPYNYRKVIGKSRVRVFLFGLFASLVNLISGYNIRYYTGLSIHLRYNILRSHPSSCGFGFQADIVTLLLDEGASYAQVRSYGIDRKGGARQALYGKDKRKPVEVLIPDATPPQPGAVSPAVGDKRVVEAAGLGGDHA